MLSLLSGQKLRPDADADCCFLNVGEGACFPKVMKLVVGDGGRESERVVEIVSLVEVRFWKLQTALVHIPQCTPWQYPA